MGTKPAGATGAPKLADLKCDTCGRPALGVASSCMGPVSFAWCRECLEQMAEPRVSFEFTYEMCGDEVADWVKDMRTWIDGTYISWDDFVALKKAEQEETDGR